MDRHFLLQEYLQYVLFKDNKNGGLNAVKTIKSDASSTQQLHRMVEYPNLFLPKFEKKMIVVGSRVHKLWLF